MGRAQRALKKLIYGGIQFNCRFLKQDQAFSKSFRPLKKVTTLYCLLKKLGKSPSQRGRINNEANKLAGKTGREWILTKEMVEAKAYSA